MTLFDFDARTIMASLDLSNVTVRPSRHHGTGCVNYRKRDTMSCRVYASCFPCVMRYKIAKNIGRSSSATIPCRAVALSSVSPCETDTQRRGRPPPLPFGSGPKRSFVMAAISRCWLTWFSRR